MSKYTVMNEEQLIEKAVQLLVREFGSVEASRFLAIPQRKREDSLKRHQGWQNGLDKDTFFDEVFSD
jgi:hypothetical protein